MRHERLRKAGKLWKSVTGGLAGILYGLPGIPKSWLSGLREREKAAKLLERLLLEKSI